MLTSPARLTHTHKMFATQDAGNKGRGGPAVVWEAPARHEYAGAVLKKVLPAKTANGNSRCFVTRKCPAQAKKN